MTRTLQNVSHLLDRRMILRAAGCAGLCWMTPLAEILARSAERSGETQAQSVIFLWLGGGPSQLETFDPHPGTAIGGNVRAIETRVSGVTFAEGMEQTAEQMDSLALVRTVVSKEGDHERATYHVKTGYRPDPTLVHPSMGAILCHQLPDAGAEIPRHISILASEWPANGGYLGAQFDAFKIDDPDARMPDVEARVSHDRFQQRLRNLQMVEKNFSRGRRADLGQLTLHQESIDRAVTMMSSEQLKAFDIGRESVSDRGRFGDTPFGRACLAAGRLVQVGVRCVEVSLNGWDSHINNHDIHRELKKSLDPALAGLIAYLKDHDLLQRTIVICAGEFGRTPVVNPAGGRDHWPHGFSIALAGGRFRGGHVVGQTDPAGSQIPFDKGVPLADIHATLLHALGVDPALELMTPVGRPMKLSDGKVIAELLS